MIQFRTNGQPHLKTMMLWNPFELLPIRAIILLIFAALLVLLGIQGCLNYHEPITYHIARDASWFPLNLFGKEQNMVAFTNELFQEIASREKLNIHIVPADAKTILEVLTDKKVDGILSTMKPTIANSELYLFSDPFYQFGSALIIPKDAPEITSLAQLITKHIAIPRSSPILFSLPNYPSMNLTTYDSPLIALDYLLSHEVDGVVMDQMTAYAFLKGLYKDQLKLASVQLAFEGLRLVTLKTPSSADLIHSFNAGLTEIKESGIYDKLLEKWDLGFRT